MYHATHTEIKNLIQILSMRIAKNNQWDEVKPLKIYPIPRGGIPVSYRLIGFVTCTFLVETPEEADIFVDDIVDSGATRDRYREQFPDKPFYGMIDRTVLKYNWKPNEWIVFPWEQNEKDIPETVDDNIRRLLQYVGEDINRGGLLETPARVAKAWKFWCSGYEVDPASVLKVFEDGADGYDQMIVRKEIPIHSHCEHHLAAILGTCTIAYIPNGKIVGLSKLDRIVQVFARRLQVQERLTSQIADALMEHLQPLGVGVYISARHLCIESRGVSHANSETVTTALRGCIKHEDSSCAEFLALARG